MNELEMISEQEKYILLAAPAYISLLAANAEGEMDEAQKTAVVELTHIKTFASKPSLRNFYKEVEKNFESTINKLNGELPKERSEREHAIKEELKKLDPILDKMQEEFATDIRNSLHSYVKHVSEAHRNVLDDFIIPFSIKGLTA